MTTPLAGCELTVLSENTSGRPWVLGEWGLSLWIQAGCSRILLDTGIGSALVPNAEQLEIDLSAADCLVLSHGHVDHVGGLEAVLRARPGLPVYLHPDSLKQRYSRLDTIGLEPVKTEEIGMSEAVRSALERDAELHFVTGPTQIAPSVWATGEIPRDEPLEAAKGPGFLDRELTQPDPIPGDMAVWIETEAGVLVILGCAHAGLVNTIRHIQSLTDGAPVVGIVGGTHLIVANDERMSGTVAFLRELPLRLLAPCHCTGPRGIHELRSAFPSQFTAVSAGSRLTFPPPT
jgi:7,8-dihydropterin-6-yl-methyl-4-(beta-D-ribofuranosyl)aminobenzene 5'-phosphate synthase